MLEPAHRRIRSSVRAISVVGYGATVRVELSDPLLIDELRGFLPSHVDISESSEDSPDVTLVSSNVAPRYWVRLGARTIGWSDEVEMALWWVANAVSYLIATRADMTFVHAGVVEVEGSAVILPGRSRW